MNLVNKVKDKWDKKKLKKLEKKEIWLRGEIARLQDQQETLKMAETTTNLVEEKCHLMIKKKPERYASKEIGHDKREEFSHTTRSKELRKEEMKPSTKCETLKNRESSSKEVRTTLGMNQKHRNKIVKRCHMCRKRGHIHKECPSKHMLRNWWQNKAKNVREHHVVMQSVIKNY